MTTAHDDFAAAVDRQPAGAVAAVCDREAMTYGEWCARGRTLARGLFGAGIEPGESVALLLPNGNSWLEAAYAVSFLGGTMVPLSTWAVEREIVEILRHSGAAAIISVDAFQGASFIPAITSALEDSGTALRVAFVLGDEASGRRGHPSLKSFDELRIDDAGSAVHDTRPQVASEIGVLLYTSGTTGSPKGVMLGRNALAENGRNIAARVGLEASDRTFNSFPFFFSAGLCNILHSAVAVGACVVTGARFDPVEAATQLAEFGCTARAMWLDTYKRMAAAPLFDLNTLARLKGILPIPASVGTQDLVDNAVNMWGMTETCAIFTTTSFEQEAERRLGSYGRPFPGTDLRIVDPVAGGALPPGAEGEIHVRGYNLMQGYLGAASPFDDEGYFHTGDSGFVDEHGDMHYRGRMGSVIKSKGFTIYPEEVEAVLRSHQDVEQVAVVDVTDGTDQTIVVALVSEVAGVAIDLRELNAYCTRNLSKYKIPTIHLVSRESVPVTATGKVIRGAARELAASLEADRLAAGEPIAD